MCRSYSFTVILSMPTQDPSCQIICSQLVNCRKFISLIVLFTALSMSAVSSDTLMSYGNAEYRYTRSSSILILIFIRTTLTFAESECADLFAVVINLHCYRSHFRSVKRRRHSVHCLVDVALNVSEIYYPGRRKMTVIDAVFFLCRSRFSWFLSSPHSNKRSIASSERSSLPNISAE